MSNSIRKIDLKFFIRDILAVFIKNISLFLVIASIVGGLIYYYSEKVYKAEYTSSVTFIVKPATKVTADNLSSSYAVIKQISKSFPYIVLNDGMKEIIREDTGEEISLNDIKVENLADTSSFTVSVVNEDKDKSFAILDTIIKNYSDIGKKIIGDTYINIISEISTSDVPSNINNSKINALIGMGIVAAIMLVAYGFLVYNKKTIRNKRDLQNYLSLDCLISLPKVRGKGRVLINSIKTPYLIKEQIKKLRIKVEGWNREVGAKVFLITSSLADEGKSTTSINLAFALLEKNYKVVVIDMDFRNPSIVKILGYEKEDVEWGIKDLIESPELKVDDIIFDDINTGLKVISSGEINIRSIKSIINIDVLKDMFDELKEHYDYIIMDTPPSSLLSDASDISHLADFGIYVVRCDYAPISVIEDGLDLLSDSGLKFMGCVLNYSTDNTKSYYKYYKRKGKING